jgi:hypothetical protein
VGDNWIHYLRENCKSYNLIALFYFILSKLSKSNYLVGDNLVFCFTA